MYKTFLFFKFNFVCLYSIWGFKVLREFVLTDHEFSLSLHMCLYGTHTVCSCVCECECWVHRSTDVLSPYGWQVGLSHNSPLCGDLAAYTPSPLLPFSSLHTPARMMWHLTCGVAWVFVYECLTAVCVCVCARGNEASSVWELVLPEECVSSERAYGRPSASLAQVAATSPSPPGSLQMPHRHGQRKI